MCGPDFGYRKTSVAKATRVATKLFGLDTSTRALTYPVTSQVRSSWSAKLPLALHEVVAAGRSWHRGATSALLCSMARSHSLNQDTSLAKVFPETMRSGSGNLHWLTGLANASFSSRNELVVTLS